MFRIILPALLSIAISGQAGAGEPASVADATDTAAEAISLAGLAAAADFVALVQVKDTDYFTRRNIPVAGSAFLQILIPYKTAGEALIEVFEKDLHPHECYFPNPTVFEEGRRYLVFLRQDPAGESRYRGMPQGCAVDVLVNTNNRYALRYPVTGVALADPLKEMAVAMKFSDGYAVIADEDLPPGQREALLGSKEIAAHSSGHWIYTRGIPLTEARKLMGLNPLPD